MELRLYTQPLQAIDRHLAEFAEAAPAAEAEARELLATIPRGGGGPVTMDVVLAELGDVRRSRSPKKARAYVAIARRLPCVRVSLLPSGRSCSVARG